MIPQAHVSYHPDLRPENRIRRQAECALHKRNSVEFVGAGEGQDGKVYWTFRCTALTTRQQRADHMFSARPDPTGPKDASELADWVMRQRVERAQVPVTRSQT